MTFVWEFQNGTPATLLDVFSPNPVVTVVDQSLGLNAFLTVFDATGQARTRSIRLGRTGQ